MNRDANILIHKEALTAKETRRKLKLPCQYLPFLCKLPIHAAAFRLEDRAAPRKGTE